MNYWIFQAVPEKFDLRDDVRFHDGMDDSWRVTRYRTRMSTGDLVYFWLGGPESIRGIYGWGKLFSEPYEEGGIFNVDVHVARRLPGHIHVDAIRENSELKKLLILKMAVGTNFLINQREAFAIRNMLPRDLRPEGPQNG